MFLRRFRLGIAPSTSPSGRSGRHRDSSCKLSWPASGYKHGPGLEAMICCSLISAGSSMCNMLLGWWRKEHAFCTFWLSSSWVSTFQTGATWEDFQLFIITLDIKSQLWSTIINFYYQLFKVHYLGTYGVPKGHVLENILERKILHGAEYFSRRRDHFKQAGL